MSVGNGQVLDCMIVEAQVMLGSDIRDAGRQSIEFADRLGCFVRFRFNGESLLVRPGDSIVRFMTEYAKRVSR